MRIREQPQPTAAFKPISNNITLDETIDLGVARCSSTQTRGHAHLPSHSFLVMDPAIGPRHPWIEALPALVREKKIAQLIFNYCVVESGIDKRMAGPAYQQLARLLRERDIQPPDSQNCPTTFATTFVLDQLSFYLRFDFDPTLNYLMLIQREAHLTSGTEGMLVQRGAHLRSGAEGQKNAISYDCVLVDSASNQSVRPVHVELTFVRHPYAKDRGGIGQPPPFSCGDFFNALIVPYEESPIRRVVTEKVRWFALSFVYCPVPTLPIELFEVSCNPAMGQVSPYLIQHQSQKAALSKLTKQQATSTTAESCRFWASDQISCAQRPLQLASTIQKNTPEPPEPLFLNVY